VTAQYQTNVDDLDNTMEEKVDTLTSKLDTILEKMNKHFPEVGSDDEDESNNLLARPTSTLAARKSKME